MSKMKDYYEEHNSREHNKHPHIGGNTIHPKKPTGPRTPSDINEVLGQRKTTVSLKKTNRHTLEEKLEELTFDVYQIQDELAEVLISKHRDYGSKNISESPGGPLNGLRVRMYDKIARLNNLVDNNVEPQNESLRDTLVDIANYATIGLLVIDGLWEQ